MGRKMSRQTARALRLLAAGVSVTEAARRTGATQQAVTAARKRAGIPSSYRRLDREAILRDYREMTAEEVAEKHGCSVGTVMVYATRERQTKLGALSIRVMRLSPRVSGRKRYRFRAVVEELPDCHGEGATAPEALRQLADEIERR